jgi:hypothetical protein
MRFQVAGSGRCMSADGLPAARSSSARGNRPDTVANPSIGNGKPLAAPDSEPVVHWERRSGRKVTFVARRAPPKRMGGVGATRSPTRIGPLRPPLPANQLPTKLASDPYLSHAPAVPVARRPARGWPRPPLARSEDCRCRRRRRRRIVKRPYAVSTERDFAFALPDNCMKPWAYPSTLGLTRLPSKVIRR